MGCVATKAAAPQVMAEEAAPSAADVPPQAPAEPEAALELKHCALGDVGGMMAQSDDNRRSNTSRRLII